MSFDYFLSCITDKILKIFLFLKMKKDDEKEMLHQENFPNRPWINSVTENLNSVSN